VEARTVQVQYDYASRMARPIPEAFRRILETDLVAGVDA
jgi:acyl-CoA thioesterase FadM